MGNAPTSIRVELYEEGVTPVWGGGVTEGAGVLNQGGWGLVRKG